MEIFIINKILKHIMDESEFLYLIKRNKLLIQNILDIDDLEFEIDKLKREE